MLDIDIQEMVKGGISRYELVAATAKRARQIVDKAQENHDIIIEKPVSIAVKEYKEGMWTIIPDENVEGRADESIK